MVRTTWLAMAAGLLLASACGLDHRIDERIVEHLPGDAAARLQSEAAFAVQERLLESLGGMNMAYTGDAKWVVVPLAKQPNLGENVTAVTAPDAATGKLAPAFRGATLLTQTGYVEATEKGPDGTAGWYRRAQNGVTFYYKTLPETDLSRGWPSNVQALWAGWRGGGALRGQTWWIKSEVVSPTHVRGEWRFSIGDDAPKYAGTRYSGQYDFERVPDRQTIVTVDGLMRLVNEKATRQSYTHFAYGYTNATDVETGVFYYGAGKVEIFNERPAWAEHESPAGDAWTNDTQRPGLYYYRMWAGQASAWWTYDGKTQTCSTTPYAVVLRGPDVVAVGRTLQLSADAYTACKERLRYRTLRWGSRNPALAAVNDAGLVSGIAPGVTDVTVNALNAWGSMRITVRELDLVPAKVGISDGSSVQIGGTLNLDAWVLNKYNETLAVPVVWNSANAAIAQVDDTGGVTGRAEGSVVIRATAGGITRERSLRVYDPSAVETLTLTCPVNRTVVAAAVQCSATGFSYTGAALGGTVFTWSTSNPAVLTVSPAGTVTPVAKGSATVTVSANGKQKQLTFTVYDQNDVVAVTVSSANGATLRLGDAAYKLALTAKAYNAAGVEIPGVSFTWSTDAATIAQVAAGSPSSAASVSAGSAEGTTNIRATTPNATVGTLSVGNWDNRVAAIRILDGGLNDVAIVAMAFQSNFRLYVRSYNASNRELGFVTPTWTVPVGLAVDANGLLSAGTTPGSFTMQAAAPKSGGGEAIDTLSVSVYDAQRPAELASDCTGTYAIFAGGTLDCQVTKTNAQGAVIAGAPVTWYVSDPARLAVVSQVDAGSPGSVQFQVPAELATGGSVTFKAYASCDGTPQTPDFGNCVVSAAGTVVARGTHDVHTVAIVAPAAGTKVGVGDSVVLVAKAYDFQDPPQEITGVSFTFSRQSGTSFTAPGAAGAVTATAEGDTYFQATANPGGVASSSFGHSLQGVDPARATIVTLGSAPAALPSLRPYQSFTVWAAATNGLGTPLAAPTFNFTTSNARLAIIATTATTATLRFIRCDCANTATNTAAVTATYAGAGGAQASRTVTVLNPVYNLTVNPPANTLVPDAGSYTVSVTINGYDGQPAPAAATVALQEQGSSPAYDVAGLDLVSLVYQNGNALAVNVYAEDASTASTRTVAWTFIINPTPIVMSGATSGSPGLANGYLAKELYYFGSAADFDKAVTYATWTTTGTTPDRTYTNVTNQPLTVLNGGFYGLAKLSTGSVVTSRIGVRMFGYVKSTSSTLYLRNQAWERVRVRLGGTTVLEEWSTTGASAPRAVKLTGFPTNTWVPLEVFGLMNAAQTVNGQKLGYVLWSANGTSFADTPSTAGVTLAQDP